MKVNPTEQSAVRLVLAMVAGWGFDLERDGNAMLLYAEGATDFEPQVFRKDLSSMDDWLGDLLDQANIPNPAGS